MLSSKKLGAFNIAEDYMISFLEGTIEFKGERFVIVSVGGIGYKAYIHQSTLNKIPEKAGFVKLWTHFHVRENAFELYGFLHNAEVEFFELLIGVSGVGPKTALGISGMAPLDTLRRAIAAGDTSYLTKVSGVGTKTAQKIILELKEKMAGRGVMIEAPELKDAADAIDALISLGYSQYEAREALNLVPAEVTGIEKRVKEALKKLAGVRRR